MKVLKIKLSTIEQVKKFVNTMCTVDCDVDLKSGRYTIDAKSIMGIFSLDLLNPIEMIIHCDDCAGEVVEAVKEFIVE